jgi:hypothetical protein
MQSDTHMQGTAGSSQHCSLSSRLRRTQGSLPFYYVEETHPVTKKVLFDHSNVQFSMAVWFEQRASCFLSLIISIQAFTSPTRELPQPGPVLEQAI